MCALTFRGIDVAGFGGYTLTDQILYNMKWYLDWGFANNGAYTIYEYDSSSWFDEDEAKLHPILDARYEEGRVWEGAGREWLWESGVNVGDGSCNPFRVSGVYVDDVFYSTNSIGVFAHHVDYLNGRIIFDEPKGSSQDIRAEYVSRDIHVGFADSIDFRKIMLEAVEEFLSDTLPSGTPARENQVWLPSVFLEIRDGQATGLQLGGGQIKKKTIVFHIFADNPQDRNLLMDWIDFQCRTVFWMADLNSITFPFDEYGDVIPGATNWVDMLASHPWKRLRGVNSSVSTINSLNSQLFRARVVWEIEVDVENI